MSKKPKVDAALAQTDLFKDPTPEKLLGVARDMARWSVQLRKRADWMTAQRKAERPELN